MTTSLSPLLKDAIESFESNDDSRIFKATRSLQEWLVSIPSIKTARFLSEDEIAQLLNDRKGADARKAAAARSRIGSILDRLRDDADLAERFEAFKNGDYSANHFIDGIRQQFGDRLILHTMHQRANRQLPQDQDEAESQVGWVLVALKIKLEDIQFLTIGYLHGAIEHELSNARRKLKETFHLPIQNIEVNGDAKIVLTAMDHRLDGMEQFSICQCKQQPCLNGHYGWGICVGQPRRPYRSIRRDYIELDMVAETSNTTENPNSKDFGYISVRRRVAVQSLTRGELGADDFVVIDPADGRTNEFDRLMELEHFRHAWNSINPKYRNAIELVDFKGMTQAQAASVLGISDRTVRECVKLGKEQLASWIRSQHRDPSHS